jgi:hypothetical protein
VTYRVAGRTFDIRVENPAGVCHGVAQLWLDGELLPGNEFPVDGEPGCHAVRVVLRGSPQHSLVE